MTLYTGACWVLCVTHNKIYNLPSSRILVWDFTKTISTWVEKEKRKWPPCFLFCLGVINNKNQLNELIKWTAPGVQMCLCLSVCVLRFLKRIPKDASFSEYSGQDVWENNFSQSLQTRTHTHTADDGRAGINISTSCSHSCGRTKGAFVRRAPSEAAAHEMRAPRPQRGHSFLRCDTQVLIALSLSHSQICGGRAGDKQWKWAFKIWQRGILLLRIQRHTSQTQALFSI